MSTTHRIEAGRQNVHGYFSRELTPVATIDSGDTVDLRTLDAGWHPDPDAATGRWHHDEHVDWYNSDTDVGHALNGPIEIRGAKPGMTLEVSIDRVIPGAWGWSLGGGWESELNSALGIAEAPPAGDWWTLDNATSIATNRDGVRIAMRPFCGVMGMPPPEAGHHATAPPRIWGGNIDCKELVAGTKLYLPIAVPGALFSAGDGHAAQGDGEVSGVAIECPLESAQLTLTLIEDMVLNEPRAWTPDAWLTFGFDADLDRAATMAVDAMLDLINEQTGLDRKRSMSLASLVVDLRVTQVVNGVKGVHAVLPHDSGLAPGG